MLGKFAARCVALGALVIGLTGAGFTVADAPEAKADGGCFGWHGLIIHFDNCWGDAYPGYGYAGFPVYFPPPPPPPVWVLPGPFVPVGNCICGV